MPRSRLLLVAGLLVLVALLAANVWRALSFGMDKNPPFWVVDAIPPALSDLRFGGAGDYASLQAVSDTFYASIRAESPALDHDSSMVQRGIARVMQLDSQTMARDIVLLNSEDKGIVDLVKLSFLIFGYTVEPILLVYFILLSGSIALFVLSFPKNSAPLLTAAAFLAAHYLLLPLVFYNPQLKSVLALRFLPVLSMMACLHCLFFIQHPSVTFLRVAALLGQIALLVFTVHLRSVTLWEVALVIGFGVGRVLWLVVRSPGVSTSEAGTRRAPFSTLGGIALPAVALLLGIVSLQEYRKARFNPRYFQGEQMATRVFWHNILSGFAFNPALASSYGFKIDDSSEAHAVGLYLTQRGREEEWKAMGGMTMTEPWIWSTGFYRIKLGKYDLIAKELLVSICQEHPGQSAATFIYHKPASLARHLAWLYGFRRDVPDVDVFVSAAIGDAMAVQLHELQTNLDTRQLRVILWDWVGLLTVLAGALLLACRPQERPMADWIPVGLLMAGSLIPTIVGYPGMHTIAEPTLMLATVVYVGAMLGLSRLMVYAWSRVKQIPVAPQKQTHES